ncbi:MAG: putative glycoside hydrolase [Deltaproteobacteria bacterium]
MQIYLVALLALSLFFQTGSASANSDAPAHRFQTQGIYVQQLTALNKPKLDHLINNSLEVGINTLVVDLWWPSAKYKSSIQRIQEHGLRYVPRITMFDGGGTREQITNQQYWEERWKLAKYALDLGAKDVQLDYIRYSSKNAASPNNALDIREILRFFKKRINERGAQLQIDVFGEVGLAPSMHIGQDITVFAPEIDAVCPMVYPSHYEPFAEHAKKPYETVFTSLMGMKRQMGKQQVPVLAYIELFNFRHSMNTVERVKYIRAQLRAVREARAEGWLAWSAGNHYDLLFEILRQFKDEAAS